MDEVLEHCNLSKLLKLYFLPLLSGHFPITFRTPPVSPPRSSYLSGMRRVCSLEFGPHMMSSPDSGLASPLLGSGHSSDRSLLPQSTIYSWSCGHFSKPLLTAADDSEELIAKREEREKFTFKHLERCQRSCRSFLSNFSLFIFCFSGVSYA